MDFLDFGMPRLRENFEYVSNFSSISIDSTHEEISIIINRHHDDLERSTKAKMLAGRLLRNAITVERGQRGIYNPSVYNEF